MSDNKNINPNSEIDDILEEIKRAKQEEEKRAKEESAEPSKTWSIDDIDRLIAESNGEEYVPKPKKPSTPAEDFERILSREFDTGIFTVRPMEEAQPKEEMQDISSMSSDDEVDGQETFFAGEEAEEFDIEEFELETVVVPEDEPTPPPAMFAWQEPSAKKEEPKENEPQKITPKEGNFYEGDVSQESVFGKKEEPSETKVIDYRTRFFETLKLENTVEIDPVYDGPVDRSGIVVRKSDEQAEGGLDALPRILAAVDA